MNTRQISYSAGRIITLWRIIYLLKQFSDQDVEIQDIINIIEASGFLGGTAPVKDSINIGQIYDFLKINNGIIQLTEYSKNELVPFCNHENPNVEIYKKLIFPILAKNKFYWLIFFNEDPSIFKIAIPQDWIDLIESAELFNFNNSNVYSWWQKLLQWINAYDNEKRKKIGDFGEELSISFERNRLHNDGFGKTHYLLQWVSRLSDREGYDIKSVRGTLLGVEKKLKEIIQIEVKSSISSNVDNFCFFVTRNEWKNAQKNLNSYFFHCWAGINLEKKKYSSGPYIIPAKSIINQFPLDNTENCQWTECKFTLDISQYKI